MPLALSGTRLASRNSRHFSWRQLISNLPRFRSDERGAEGLSDTEVIVQMRTICRRWVDLTCSGMSFENCVLVGKVGGKVCTK